MERDEQQSLTERMDALAQEIAELKPTTVGAPKLSKKCNAEPGECSSGGQSEQWLVCGLVNIIPAKRCLDPLILSPTQ